MLEGRKGDELQRFWQGTPRVHVLDIPGKPQARTGRSDADKLASPPQGFKHTTVHYPDSRGTTEDYNAGFIFEKFVPVGNSRGSAAYELLLPTSSLTAETRR